MGTKWWSSSAVLAAGLAIAGLLSGCGQSKCLDCGGDNPCPSFLGTYVGEQQGSLDTCGSWYLLVGTSVIQVETQENNALSLELLDPRGLWAVFTGKLCNTDNQQTPRRYSFDATYQINEPGEDYQVMYSMSGYFTEANGAALPRIDGTLTISLFFHNTADSNCTLAGDFDGELSE